MIYKDQYMAVSTVFLCNEIHKDPTLKGGCIKPYVFIGKATIIAQNYIFDRDDAPPRILFFS